MAVSTLLDHELIERPTVAMNLSNESRCSKDACSNDGGSFESVKLVHIIG